MPNLGVQQTISFMDIETVSNLANYQRPVYLLTSIDNSHVVIKKELATMANDPSNLRHNLKTMKAVSPDAAGKALTPNEVAELNRWVDAEELVSQYAITPITQPVAHLKRNLQGAGVWYKMARADGIMDLEGAKAMAAGNDKSAIRSIASALRAPSGLEALGKIIAADLFNGNTDRFAPAGGAPDPNLTVCINPGNVLLAVKNGTLQPIGLDSYEAQGMFRHINQTIASLEANSVSSWGGRLLSSAPPAPTQLINFCTAVVDDIEYLLGPRNRKIPLTTTRRLPKDAAVRLVAGVNQGAALIKQKMITLRNKPNPPAGLVDRMQILGW